MSSLVRLLLLLSGIIALLGLSTQTVCATIGTNNYADSWSGARMTKTAGSCAIKFSKAQPCGIYLTAEDTVKQESCVEDTTSQSITCYCRSRLCNLAVDHFLGKIKKLGVYKQEKMEECHVFRGAPAFEIATEPTISCLTGAEYDEKKELDESSDMKSAVMKFHGGKWREPKTTKTIEGDVCVLRVLFDCRVLMYPKFLGSTFGNSMMQADEGCNMDNLGVTCHCNKDDYCNIDLIKFLPKIYAASRNLLSPPHPLAKCDWSEFPSLLKNKYKVNKLLFTTTTTEGAPVYDYSKDKATSISVIVAFIIAFVACV